MCFVPKKIPRIVPYLRTHLMAYSLQVGECLHCGTDPNADLCIVSSAGLSVWYTRKKKITRCWAGERGLWVVVFIRITLSKDRLKTVEDPQEFYLRFATEYRPPNLRVVFLLAGQGTIHTTRSEQRA